MTNRYSFSSLGLGPFLTLILFFTLSHTTYAQKPEEGVMIDKIFDLALTDSRSYEWLRDLSYNVGHRLSGSPSAAKAVQWGKQMLDTVGLDKVWLQPCMVPHWVRGEAEKIAIKTYNGEVALTALALGGSVPTPAGGIEGPVVEIRSWEQLDTLGAAGVKGKIVFYNRPMEPTYLKTFDAYRHCVDQRVSGASRAAKYGATGVLVRSMNLREDDFPHTGGMRYDSNYALIPAAAISTMGANKLHDMLQRDQVISLWMQLNCQTLPDEPSFNVIGEIRGTEQPNDVILVGGHLDSWDVGQGAHDDGAGVVQSMDVLRLLHRMGYRPRHTIRCVLFMNEENGLRGGRAYAAEAERKGEYPLCSIESDAGGFTPRGFSFEGDDAVFGKLFEKIKTFEPLFEPYDLKFKTGGSGADISPLKGMKGLLSGYSPDSQRYFDYHHSADDTFDKVNKRELELGTACMAALVYLVDKYGL